MQSDRIERVKFIVSAALARPADEREPYLQAVCGGDTSLRNEVDYYINHSEKTEQFFYHSETARVTNDFADAPTEAFSDGLPTDPRVGKILGKYVIQRRLAEGGMGVIYVALDTQLGREVALKVLPEFFSHDRERLLRFQREARTTSLLNHPNIVSVFEIGEMDGCQFIVTEYVEGETLREKMTASAIPFPEALKICIQIAGALGTAHRAGVVHRDIKPENVMLRPDGYVKVLDFGLAKVADIPQGNAIASHGSIRRTMPGTIMGTAAYMSPEQAEGAEVDARTDIWSLGVLLYEMAAGKLPFEGPTASHTIVAILEQAPEPIDRISPDVQRIVAIALQKDRARRFQTAEAMSAALEELKHKLGYISDQKMVAPATAVREPDPVAVPKRKSPYRKLLWMVPAAFFVLLIFTAGIYGVALLVLNSSFFSGLKPSGRPTPTPMPTRTVEPTPVPATPTPVPSGVYVSPTPTPTLTPTPTPERKVVRPPRVIPTPAPTVKPTPVIVRPTPRPTPRSTPRPRPSQDPNCVFTNSCH